jgi:hypothetical protein
MYVALLVRCLSVFASLVRKGLPAVLRQYTCRTGAGAGGLSFSSAELQLLRGDS